MKVACLPRAPAPVRLQCKCMPDALAVYLLDSTSYRLLATLPSQAGPLQDRRAVVSNLGFLADGLSLVNDFPLAAVATPSVSLRSVIRAEHAPCCRCHNGIVAQPSTASLRAGSLGAPAYPSQ